MIDDGPPTDHDAFRRQRLQMLTGPGGSLSMIAMPAITTVPRTFEGFPGTWSCPDALGVSVTATTADDLLVDGELLVGTAVLGPGSSVTFSDTVSARVAQEVDGTWYLQVSDTKSANLADFDSVETYDYDPAWVVDARYHPRVETDRPTMAGRLGSGDLHRRDSPGDVGFTMLGQQHRLAVYATFSADWVSVNFTDLTSRSETPSAGRIMMLPRENDSAVVLDFNRAMLLPHESSGVYPCPLPPEGNHLPVAVTAGERAVRFNR